MLSENGELILKNKEIANTFNDHFGSIVDTLGWDHWDDHSLSPCCHRRKVLIGFIVSSNGIKTTPASRISKQNLTAFAVSLFR